MQTAFYINEFKKALQMKKQITLALLVAILCNSTTLAKAKTEEQLTPSVNRIELSFEQAFELMMANNNALKACLADIKAKQYEKKAAIGTFFPIVGVDMTYVHFGDDVSVNTPPVHAGGTTINIPSILIQDKNLWTTNFGAVWNIFTGGKRLALTSAARAKLEGSNNNYKKLTNNLTIALVEKYYGLIFFEDVSKAKKQVLDSNKQHLEDAKKLEKTGIIPKSERLHAEVAYNQALRDYKASLRDIDVIEEGLMFVAITGNLRSSFSFGAFFASLGFSLAGITYPTTSMPLGIKMYSSLLPIRPFVNLFVDQTLRGFQPHYEFIYLRWLLILILFTSCFIPLLKKKAKNEKYWFGV